MPPTRTTGGGSSPPSLRQKRRDSSVSMHRTSSAAQWETICFATASPSLAAENTNGAREAMGAQPWRE
eukprot:CAMPEP_0198245266 /NCGR_PEP_ID=MMETSP1446-20131203/40123_1 /TAXON_ID=1461542 ORGANISM="Unidentified sp, Strain CCMP2111" /NCGR_SAMPLE_ID=MMETSP1446 /ASSEMBLY_ACC=CAM_ASM_001112 /LENGTH=67 /DNA_ID=CAMNT_0043929423 /DNA_START=84 /DNA_END=287 /DNA_ORIENTATION=+